MRNAILGTACFWVLFSACGSKNKPPRHILEQDKMEAVLWDLMRADQFLSIYVLPKDSTRKKLTESQKLYSQIFQLHKIDEKQFRQSFEWYKQHPQLLAVVMDSVSTRASQLAEPAPTSVATPVIDTSNVPEQEPEKTKADTPSRKKPVKIVQAD